ncbi:MAG: S24/S26 family peptidase [Pseudomonadota bacterium]
MILRLFKVTGDSMRPVYVPGDYLLVSRYWFRKPRVGDDVVGRSRSQGLVLKRVSDVDGQAVKLAGLNALSATSESLGDFKHKDILGRVFLRVAAWRAPRKDQH